MSASNVTAMQHLLNEQLLAAMLNAIRLGQSSQILCRHGFRVEALKLLDGDERLLRALLGAAAEHDRLLSCGYSERQAVMLMHRSGYTNHLLSSVDDV